MTAALVGAGVARSAGIVLADELRLGLRGQVRRVLAPRGAKVVQRLQLRYQWAYLLLAVDPRAGTLRRRWLEWAPDAVVRDGHGAHSATLLADLPTARVRLPPYSPELNPAERVFQEVRRRVEGRTYDAVVDKQARADAYLRGLAADPARVRQLCGWGWLTAALDALPSSGLARAVGLWLTLADQEIACPRGAYQERKSQALGRGGATIGGGPARPLTDPVTPLAAPGGGSPTGYIGVSESEQEPQSSGRVCDAHGRADDPGRRLQGLVPQHW